MWVFFLSMPVVNELHVWPLDFQVLAVHHCESQLHEFSTNSKEHNLQHHTIVMLSSMDSNPQLQKRSRFKSGLLKQKQAHGAMGLRHKTGRDKLVQTLRGVACNHKGRKQGQEVTADETKGKQRTWTDQTWRPWKQNCMAWHPSGGKGGKVTWPCLGVFLFGWLETSKLC